MPVRKTTHVGCLITGDRFYFPADEKRTVWEVRYHSTRIATMEKRSRCATDAGTVETFCSNRMVVLLRREEGKQRIVQPVLFETPRRKRRKRQNL